MRKVHLLALAVLVLCSLGACKTTEENYRQAYESTVAARAERDSIDTAIYGKNHREMTDRIVATARGDVAVRTKFVRVTDDGGGTDEMLNRYNVVVGQFTQVFNAKSFRKRLAAASFPDAFVVETSEPHYYIVVASFGSAADASDELKRIVAEGKVKMKAPCPFILDATARRAPAAKNSKK